MALFAPQLKERPACRKRSYPTALDGGVTRSPHYARNAASAPVARLALPQPTPGVFTTCWVLRNLAKFARGKRMTDTLIENVSDTAFWVAHYRAFETERADALFHDPLAGLLAGDRGKK